MDLTLIIGLIVLLIIVVALLYFFERYNKAHTKEKQSPFIEKPQQQYVQQPERELRVKEVTTIVKIPCPYCGTLNEITEKKCSGCGAAVGGK